MESICPHRGQGDIGAIISSGMDIAGGGLLALRLSGQGGWRGRPGMGPFWPRGPCLSAPAGHSWLWGLALGLALGLGVALALRHWRLARARRAGEGRLYGGDMEMIQGALRLVEQVFADGQRRLKVVDFDRWVARRKRPRPEPEPEREEPEP